MEKEIEPKISLDAKQLELIAESLGERQKAMREKKIGDVFINLRLIPSIIKLSETEKKEETLLRKRASSFINLVDSKKLFITEDDFNPPSISCSPSFEEIQAKNRELQKKVVMMESKLIEDYDKFVMGLLHKKGFFEKGDEREA